MRKSKFTEKQIAFVAVLDSRTSIVCASHDGEVHDIDEPFLIPPMHHNCRSLLKPVFGGKQIGMRKATGSSGQKKVGANTNFATWFARQSEDFQREWFLRVCIFSFFPRRYRMFPADHRVLSYFPTLRFVEVEKLFSIHMAAFFCDVGFYFMQSWLLKFFFLVYFFFFSFILFLFLFRPVS